MTDESTDAQTPDPSAVWDVQFQVHPDGTATWRTTAIEGNFGSILTLSTQVAAALGIGQVERVWEA